MAGHPVLKAGSGTGARVESRDHAVYVDI